jgi:hypothetical protein
MKRLKERERKKVLGVLLTCFNNRKKNGFKFKRGTFKCCEIYLVLRHHKKEEKKKKERKKKRNNYKAFHSVGKYIFLF